MAFTPIALPIQELLLTNFVTDIATITNSNTLLLQAKVEDLINNLEIDTAGLSIGTSNPINYVKANSVVLQDQGLTFQVGLPTPVVKASLAKDGSNNSVFTVDKIISNISAQFNAATLNSLTVNSGGTVTVSSPSTFGANVTVNNSFCESKETVTVDLKANVGATSANATLTLSSTSRQNIFVTLNAANSGADQVYDSGSASILSSINDLNLIINFDSVSPPAQNTVFTIYLVDVSAPLTPSIITAVQLKNCPFYIKAGTNNNTTFPIILHDNTRKVGIPLSNTFKKYATNVSFMYIKDSTSSDRLIVKSLVDASLF